ncbi:MAG TPA: response regulator [Marinobacterium sp.]|nr:response regulator [Marinobacterium sp.]
MHLRTAIKVYIALTTVLILILGSLLVFAESKHSRAQQLFQEQVRTQLLSKDLLQALTDRETGQRGYLLTLDPRFVEPYIEGGLKIKGLIEDLKPLMAIDAWNELKRLIAERGEYFNTTFQLVGGFPLDQQQQQQQQQQAIERVRSGDGKRFMDSMRELLRQTPQEVERLANEAAARYEGISAWTSVLIYTIAVSVFMLLISPIIYLRRAVFDPLLRLRKGLRELTGERKPMEVSTKDSAPEIRDIIEQTGLATSKLIDYEEELRGSIDELKAVRDQQDKIFSIVGHELRTPASAVKMLLEEEKGHNNSHYIQEAYVHSTHLLNILEDMRISTSVGAILEVPSEFNHHVKVFQIVKSTILALQPLASQHDFIINFNGSRAHRLGHDGTPKILHQVLQNLIRNAILHSEGSMINVSLEFEHLECNATHFTIEVRDNGKGISPQFRNRMFKAFERGDTVSDGTGLGLNVAYELAKTQENGNLSYRDNPTGGSIFTFEFTLNKVIDASASATEEKKINFIKGLNVLLVEDTPTLRLLSKTILERAGANVQATSNGEEALSIFASFEPDLVLTDIMMPDMNGYELTEALRKGGYSMPIIGVTGATVGMEAKRLIETGANRVLAKPLTIAGLEAAIKSIHVEGFKARD